MSEVLDWPAPKSVRELQSFLGFANFYRRFIQNCSGIISPLTDNLKKNTSFQWMEKCEVAFRAFKRQFTEAPVLAHYREYRETVLEMDASMYAIGGVLSQRNEAGEMHLVTFMSRKLIAAERNYDTYDRELLAIIEAVRIWRHYLEGLVHFTSRTDHRNLEYFRTPRTISGRQARWSNHLNRLKYQLECLPGSQNGRADALSRRSDHAEPDEGTEEVQAISGRSTQRSWTYCYELAVSFTGNLVATTGSPRTLLTLLRR